MNENIAEGEEDDDHDIIHLLNTKSKNREILSITNAAVDAVSGHEHVKTRTSQVSLGNIKDKEETKENNSISDSFTSTSSKDVSFNGRHRVRISSSLLREIKSPLERSDVVNRMDFSESGTMSTSSTLFASQSSSNQSSVQATGPVPTVIKYSSEPPVQTDRAVLVTSHQNTSHRTGTPVVVKNSPGYFASGHSHSPSTILIETEKNYQNARTDHTDRDYVKHIRPSEQMSESGAEKGRNVSHTESNSKINDNKGNILSGSNSIAEKPTNRHGSVEESNNYLTKGGNQRGRGLRQGALSSGVVHVVDSKKGQVKAVSFSLSEREKATREMLSKKQESKGVIRRVVQPKLVTARTVSENEKTPSMITSSVSPENIAVDGSTANMPAVKLPGEFEKQMKTLIGTLDVIEAQCQESRIWQEEHRQQQHRQEQHRQEQHRQELERNNKQRDERRLQNLEDMQKQLLECQLKNACYVPPKSSQLLPSTSSVTVTGTTEELPSSQVKPSTPWRPPTAGNTERELVQGVAANNLQYSQAAKHKTQSNFKTSVYSKPRDASALSGLKRKFVRNTRTQTSPQESSSLSSSEITSPLDTPLPRKRPPVPMSQDSKTTRDLSRKHVHFDTPNVKNTENHGKRRDGWHDKANLAGAIAGGHIQTSYPSRTRDIERQNSPYKRSESGDYVVNDIGKLRQELKDALKETESTKLSLKNLHDNIYSQISDDDVLAPPDHTQPYPIDAYLRATRDIEEEPETPRAQESRLPETGDQSREFGYLADGWGVLREVQKRRETLETNLLSLTRRHEEEDLYRLVDDVPNGDKKVYEDEIFGRQDILEIISGVSNEYKTTGDEVLRIRKLVGKKIGEIDAEIQSELQEEERQKLSLQKETSVENTKITKRAPRSSSGGGGIPSSTERRARSSLAGGGVPSSTERRARTRNIGKENQPRGGKLAAKPKTTKAVAKQLPAKRPIEDPSYVSRVYGRHDHVPRRTTLKLAYNHYQSPPGQTKPTTATRDKSKHQRRWDDSVSSLSEDDHHVPQSTSHRPKYYFQPSLEASQGKTHLRNMQTPLPGQLLSMAIPLGKPKRDPSLRLPVSTNEDTLELPPSRFQTVSSSVKQPNVAVITIKDEEWLSEDEQDRKHKNTTPGKEARTALETQILPNVDIDTSGFSDESVSSLPAKVVGPQILSWPDPLSRPGASEYEEFKDYEEVTNVKDIEEEKDDKESRHKGESVISLHGANTGGKLSYQGPVFPPENIPATLNVRDEFEGDVTKAASETLENKAMEWVEQELLARIISEMAPPLPDPTATLNRSRPPSFVTNSDVSDDDPTPDLLGAIGLRGMQLFVDAGIPVDNDLVRNLILEVLQEKICGMIGFPKPQAQPSSKQKPSRDHTEDELLSEESTRIETPVRSPSLTSLRVSRSPSNVPTPEQSNSEEYSSLLLSDDMKKSVVRSDHVEDDEIEEGHLDDSVDEDPVATPVVTPKSSPRQFIINLHTPEVSEQDLPESEETGVLTPEITVSIRDRTPTPQDVDDYLKEQTLIEDEAEEPDVVIPAVKFIPEIKPSIIATTNSPSSITTTTYSTQSTMGTFATDDEISEGEQLQPFVHVGQYSEGEFAAPSALAHVSLETMREIPDDIFDSFRNINKKHDVFKHALSGLLRVEGEEDDRAIAGTGEETITSTDGQRRVTSESQLSEGSLHDDISQSEGEIPLGRDVLADLLTQMRRPPPLNRIRRGTASQEQQAVEDDSSTSVGEVVPRHGVTLSRGLPGVVSEDDLSVGEVARRNHDSAVHLQLLPKQDIDRPQGSSVFDSDENNNESDRSSSIHDGHNQSWHATQDMVTPGKSTTTVFPRVVHVTEAAQRESTPSAQRREPGSKGNITMETLSDIHPTPPEAGQPQATHIKLTLPSIDPNGSPTMSEELLELDLDDTIGDASSISGGEV